MRGAFITVEGVEGVGKSSSLAVLERFLRAAGKDVVLTREPGGTELGERVREWILNGAHGTLSAEVETLLMFAARAQHLRTVIWPALERGQWVVCDRFTDATFAYQGGGRGAAPELLDCLKKAVQQGLEPDLTLLLDAPVDVGLARIRGRELDHFEREQKPFFERVRAAYLRLAESDPGRIKIIDAARAREAVDKDLEDALRRLLTEHPRHER
ncbi:MAG TPA: dTMP kinase [Gammaproteobacteria bacterium]|nr:dTMP kinase [Gammaproteobacteria bacterium]